MNCYARGVSVLDIDRARGRLGIAAVRGWLQPLPFVRYRLVVLYRRFNPARTEHAAALQLVRVEDLLLYSCRASGASHKRCV